MFFYENKKNNIEFKINLVNYVVSNKEVKKYNYDKRNKKGFATLDKVEEKELEQLVIELTKIMYKQNKIFAKNIIRGI